MCIRDSSLSLSLSLSLFLFLLLLLRLKLFQLIFFDHVDIRAHDMDNPVLEIKRKKKRLRKVYSEVKVLSDRSSGYRGYRAGSGQKIPERVNSYSNL